MLAPLLVAEMPATTTGRSATSAVMLGARAIGERVSLAIEGLDGNFTLARARPWR